MRRKTSFSSGIDGEESRGREYVPGSWDRVLIHIKKEKKQKIKGILKKKREAARRC